MGNCPGSTNAGSTKSLRARAVLECQEHNTASFSQPQELGDDAMANTDPDNFIMIQLRNEEGIIMLSVDRRDLVEDGLRKGLQLGDWRCIDTFYQGAMIETGSP